MPQFAGLPFPRRYNTLRLLGYGYDSPFRLCAVTMVTDSRTPFFADTKLAKRVLASLISEETLKYMRVRAFTLLPDHLHLLAGVRQPESKLPNLLGRFKSYSAQLYWKRSREIVEANEVCLPPKFVVKVCRAEARSLLPSLMEWRATLRPEVVELKNWPALKPQQFLRKQLWQERFFDHIIRNDTDLLENLTYIAMNSVKRGYVSHPQFYPYTGFIL